MKLPARETTPMSYDYRPELDARADLDTDDITMIQELIGELRYATYIGGIDILHWVLVLSSFKASPR